MLADFIQHANRLDEPIRHILGVRGQKTDPEESPEPVQLGKKACQVWLTGKVVAVRIDILPEQSEYLGFLFAPAR